MYILGLQLNNNNAKDDVIKTISCFFFIGFFRMLNFAQYFQFTWDMAWITHNIHFIPKLGHFRQTFSLRLSVVWAQYHSYLINKRHCLLTTPLTKRAPHDRKWLKTHRILMNSLRIMLFDYPGCSCWQLNCIWISLIYSELCSLTCWSSEVVTKRWHFSLCILSISALIRKWTLRWPPPIRLNISKCFDQLYSQVQHNGLNFDPLRHST